MAPREKGDTVASSGNQAQLCCSKTCQVRARESWVGKNQDKRDSNKPNPSSHLQNPGIQLSPDQDEALNDAGFFRSSNLHVPFEASLIDSHARFSGG
jgi:hypothetical protein